MSTLKTHTLLEEKDELFMESILLVVLNEILKVIWEDNDLHTSHVGSSEFLCSDASEANFLPDLWNVSFLGSLEGSLILLELYEDLSKLVVVSDLAVKNLSCFVETVIIASITALLNVSLVRLAKELLKFWKVSLTTLSIGENKLRVDHLLLKQ